MKNHVGAQGDGHFLTGTKRASAELVHIVTHQRGVVMVVPW